MSEETGKISVAKDGTLIADVREDVLKKILIMCLLMEAIFYLMELLFWLKKILNHI